MGDGVVLVDRAGRVIHMNRRAHELLGLGGRRVVGERLVPSLGSRAFQSFVRVGLRDEGTSAVELDLSPGVVLRATISPCRSVAGDLIGRALLLQDVTRERRIQVELSTAVVRRLLDLAGGGSTEPLPELTRRERQILELVAAGLSNLAIAARLGVSPNTVGSHMKRLYQKLGVRSRAQATARAVAHGIRPLAP